jgi:leucyl-tRNA synthetase
MPYNFQIIEKKWRKIWEKEKTFQTDLNKAKKPYYNLMMFPYPSAEGLHVGNVYAFTGSDIHGRFRRMQGYNVFEPIGFDAFGIHSENFAIKKGIHPKILIKSNINHFREQLKNLGCLFDWRYEVDTTQPNYYKWTQWLFLQFFKAGLAFRKKAPVDWCPSCKTVLADEQVINGKCERCGSQVIQKETEQWFLKITKYAERLLQNLEKIDWSPTTKTIQKNWIGKSEGWEVKFQISNALSFAKASEGKQFSINVFTTRIDTLFGATYLVLAPEHPIIESLKPQISNIQYVEQYIQESRAKTEIERISEVREKTGIEIKGLKAVNPANEREIPIFVADYVLMHYGTGAIMGVPAHDKRDFDFAKKYNLPIIDVVQSPEVKIELSVAAGPVISGGPISNVYEGEGVLINSEKFDGMSSETARERIGEWLAKKGLAKKAVYYKLRDWLISRQRYWGPPIPVVFCKNCKKRLENSKFQGPNLKLRREFSKGEIENPGWIAVPESDLPVLLPYVKNFRPEGTGQSPLASVKSFVKTTCPKCKGEARRETDVSDTFLDSSWYFLRYPCVDFDDKPFDKLRIKKWLPVDMYIGGQEHAVLHLMYSRFVTMALKDMHQITFEEPFKKFRAHGLLTKNGAKMSKSKGNVVNPDDYYKQYGADTLRMYLMFLGPFANGGDWQDRGIVGIKRFLEKVWELGQKEISSAKNPQVDFLVNETIKKVTSDLENLQYNTAISSLMILTNKMLEEKSISLANYKTLLILLAPFAPYVTEELWHRLGNTESIHNQRWPKFKKQLAEKTNITLVIQINGKVRDKIEVPADITEAKAKKLAMEREIVKKWLEGKGIKKVIFVRGKLINIVI